MTKILVANPLVNINGDEMTRVIWEMIISRLIRPYLDIELIDFDLGIKNRDDTNDQVTVQAAEAIRKYMVGVKCATITANADRVFEYDLKKAWPSPNGTIRAALDGTVFRKPILVSNVKPSVRSWIKPIVIARHAYGDMYKNVEFLVNEGQKAYLVIESTSTTETTRLSIHGFNGRGVVQGMHNTEESIRAFAKSCIAYGISEKLNIWFGAKDTISKTYHGFFRKIFQEEIDLAKEKIDAAGITYSYMLIDDVAARIMRHEGGILWCCMNYDGDVFSDSVASGFGSLGLMTSVLVSPSGVFEFEAAHGTVQKHYYQHLKGYQTSTNPTASIFAWTGALRKRGELDNNPQLIHFANLLEASVIAVIESGKMTKDLASIADNEPVGHCTTTEFFDAIVETFDFAFKA